MALLRPRLEAFLREARVTARATNDFLTQLDEPQQQHQHAARAPIQAAQLSLGVVVGIATCGTMLISTAIAFFFLWLARRRALRAAADLSFDLGDSTTVLELNTSTKDAASCSADGLPVKKGGKLKKKDPVLEEKKAAVTDELRRSASCSSVPQLPPLFAKRSTSQSLNPFSGSPRYRRTVSTWLDEDALHGPTIGAGHKNRRQRSGRQTWPRRVPTLPKLHLNHSDSGAVAGRKDGDGDDHVRDAVAERPLQPRQRPHRYTIAAALQGNLMAMPAIPAWQLPQPPRSATLPAVPVAQPRPLPDPSMYVDPKNQQPRQQFQEMQSKGACISPPKKGMLMRPSHHSARQASTDSTLSEILRSTERRLQEGGTTGVARRNLMAASPTQHDWRPTRNCAMPYYSVGRSTLESTSRTPSPSKPSDPAMRHMRSASQSSIMSEPDSLYDNAAAAAVIADAPEMTSALSSPSQSAATAAVVAAAAAQRRRAAEQLEQEMKEQQHRLSMMQLSPPGAPSSTSSELSTVYSEDEGRDGTTAPTSTCVSSVMTVPPSAKLDLKLLIMAQQEAAQKARAQATWIQAMTVAPVSLPQGQEDPFFSDSPVKGGAEPWTPPRPEQDMSHSSRLRNGVFSHVPSPGKGSSGERSPNISPTRSGTSVMGSGAEEDELRTPSKPSSARRNKFKSPPTDAVFSAHDACANLKLNLVKFSTAQRPETATLPVLSDAGHAARGHRGGKATLASNGDEMAHESAEDRQMAPSTAWGKMDDEQRPLPLFSKDRTSIQSKTSTTSVGGLSSVYDYYTDQDAPPAIPAPRDHKLTPVHENQQLTLKRQQSTSSSVYSQDIDDNVMDFKRSPSAKPKKGLSVREPRSSSVKRKGSKYSLAKMSPTPGNGKKNPADISRLIVVEGKDSNRNSNSLQVTSTIAELRRMNSTVSGYSQASSTMPGSPTLPALRGGGFSPQAKNGGTKHYLAVGSNNRTGSPGLKSASGANSSGDEQGRRAGDGRGRKRASTVVVCTMKSYNGGNEKENAATDIDGGDGDGAAMAPGLDQNKLDRPPSYKSAVQGQREPSSSGPSPEKMGIPRAGLIMATPPGKSILSRIAHLQTSTEADSPGLYDKDGFLIATPPRSVPRSGGKAGGSRT